MNTQSAHLSVRTTRGVATTRAGAAMREGILESLEPRVLLTRSSPFDPETSFSTESAGSLIVVDDGPLLDTGCTFRDGGPLVIDIPIERVLPEDRSGKKYTLKLPAYDVDYAQGERDDVYFVDGQGDRHLIGQFHGANDTWYLNSFQINAEWVDSGTQDPVTGAVTPGHNSLEVDIDVGTVNGWCTAVDWVAIGLPVRPVLLVHGILSGSPSWNGGPWVRELEKAGIPFEAIDLGALDSIESNAAKIGARVEQMLEKYGADKVNLVTHSKGGLDSRHLAEFSDKIGAIIQLDTPNGGAPIADIVQASIRAGTAIPGPAGLLIKALALGQAFAAPAGVQLTVNYMTSYDLLHGYNPDVQYFAVAGNYTWAVGSPLAGGLTVGYDWVAAALNAASRLVNLGSNSLIVPNWSVYSPLTSFITPIPAFSSSGAVTDAMHSGMGKSELAFAQVMGNAAARAALFGGGSESGQSFAAMEAGPSGGVLSGSFAGTVGAGGVEEHTITIDNNEGAFSLRMWYGSGDLDLEVVSPSGRVYTRDDSSESSGVSFLADEAVEGNKTETFLFAPGSEVGVWTVRVSGVQIVSAEGAELYVVDGQMESSPISLAVATNTATYISGQQVTVTATLTNGGAPLTAATVRGLLTRPDETSSPFVLVDDGTGGDATAGDGVYTALIGTGQAGLFTFDVTAEGASPAAFARQGSVVVPVGTGSAFLGGAYTIQGVDEDADGLYDRLRATVPVSAPYGGRFTIRAELLDSDGAVIDEAGVPVLLGSGYDSPVDIDFDGRAVYNHGKNGPYTLRVTLSEEQSGLPITLETVDAAATTDPYLYTQFEHEPLRLAGTGSVTTPDEDEDGRFDSLTISLDIDADTAGTYTWSGELLNPEGAVVGRFDTSGSLVEGRNTILFTFEGTAIWESNLNGPYRVANIALVGPAALLIPDSAVQTAALEADDFESPFAVAEVAVTLDGSSIRSGDAEAVEFGDARVGRAGQTMTFTITNRGEEALSLGEVTAPDGFEIVSLPEGTLAPGGTTTLVVRLLTDVVGERGGALTIVTNDRNENPFSIALAGSVTSFRAAASAGLLGSGSLLASDGDGVQREFARNTEGAWSQVPLGSESPLAGIEGHIASWTDPDTGGQFAAGMRGGSLVVLRKSDSAWVVDQDLSAAVAGIPAIQDLAAHVVTASGDIVLICRTAQGDVVTVIGKGSEWTAQNLSQTDLAGGERPALAGELAAAETAWGALHIFGVDGAGRLWSIWRAPDTSGWEATDLSASSGAPVLAGSVAVMTTAWGAIHVTGVDSSGLPYATWWTPEFGARWESTNLSPFFNGRSFRPETVNAFATPWGGLNLIGADAATDELVTLWWMPDAEGGHWDSTSLTSMVGESTLRPAARVEAFVPAADKPAVELYGISLDDNVFRYMWDGDAGWRYEQLGGGA